MGYPPATNTTWAPSRTRRTSSPEALALPEYDEFVLRDIKDTNAPALGLYAKLGFTEYRRRPVRFARRAGFTDYVSMRLAQTG
ncbi:hypothetical protein GCM10023088_44150 [Actinomadura verrucosospora]|uniref:hypothetical protein n=1 Tax=Actinomadura verrucosospora TaxID=46165 RepID=UPI0031E72A43